MPPRRFRGRGDKVKTRRGGEEGLAGQIEYVAGIRDVKKRRAWLEKQGLPSDQVEEALEAVHFLVKGRLKFPRAAAMRFSREGLAQASSKWVAEHRTWRMRERLGSLTKVLEVGSGIGGDTIALATRWQVVATERNTATAKILRHNLGVYGLMDQVDLIEDDIQNLLGDADFRQRIEGIDAVFFDPSRRPGGRRTPHTEAYEPPLSFAKRLLGLSPNLCVKIGPTVELAALDYDCDIEVISYKGEVRDTVLWFGGFKADPAGRRRLATKLPERLTWERPELREEKAAVAVAAAPAAFLYEPDPVFIKAGMVDDLARRYDLNLLESRLAYLTGERHVKDPALKCYCIHQTLKLDFGAVSECLQRLDIGKVDFKARGVNIDLSQVHQDVRGRGKKSGLVVFTRSAGQQVALVCGYTGKGE
jgi:hypothetical protein